MSEPIYNLDAVAERCSVTRETVVEWIDRGLRAFTLGAATKYRPRDFLIRESWLLDFLEAHSRINIIKRPEPEQVETERPKQPRTPTRRGTTSGLIGPCPVSLR